MLIMTLFFDNFQEGRLAMPSDASLRERGVVLLAFVLAAILAATLAGVMPHTGEPGHVAAPNPESYTLAGGAWPILDSAALLPQYAFAQVSPDSTYFVTTWMTYGINESVTIPVRSGLTYNYTVIWGDGTNSTGLTGDAVHKYATAGDHQVRIYGTYPQIYLNGHVDASSRLVSIDQWGSNQWVSMHSAFQGASDMTYTATDTPDLSAVTTMRDMFLGAASFDGDLSSWNVSGVTDMRLMFRGATSFDGDISDWDVSGVARMGAMFQDADSFDGDLSSWNVSGVTDMSYMFYRTDSFDGDLSDWDVSGVIDMASMFQNADSFNGDISSWNVSGVTSMSHMFSDADSFNGDLSSWNVSGVDRMDFMFTRATSFNQNLGNWYIVLDETAIDLADAGNTIGSISAQNLVLASHNFTYGLGSDSGSQKFAISGNDLQVKPGEDYSSGTYDVTITVTGAELFGTNNQRTVSVTVADTTSSDTTPPVIELAGLATLTIEAGTAYNDQGATCTDTFDGAITPTPTGEVDTSTPGDYTIAYSCVDAAGNRADPVSRTVTVEAAPASDNTPPTLRLTGSASTAITVGASYTDAGATCEDAVDGTITPTSSGTVDASQAGTYTLTYSCRDAAGNSAPDVSRDVIVEAAPASDNTPPTLRLTGSASTAITVGASYTDAGATCEDAVDGTITPTSSGTVDASHAGTYILTYSCQDAAGNSAPDVSRDVIVEAAPVSDTTPPILRLTGSASTAITVGASYTDAGATCEDAVDGTITPTSSGTVDASHAGTYILTYSCQDAAGNSAPDVSRDVIVEAAPVSDTTPPTLRLTGSASTAITVGASYTDAGATCEDAVDGTITPTSSGTVDASHAGTYILTYSCQDAAGNSAPDVSRDVIVEAAPVSDTTPPTLALIGPDPETITVGAPYTDAGATCTDTVDGTITPTSSGTVDASQAGTYTLTYSCRDAAGNDAPGVSRTVTVSAAVINTGQNPPTFVSSTLNNATGVLAITFSEDIDVTPAANVVPTKIHVRESGSYTGGITLSAGELATAVDGTVISFTLTAQHLAAVKGLAVPELTIEPGAVKDTSGDLIVGTFDVSTAAFVDAFSVSTQDPNPRGMAFSSDGTKMFVAGFASSSVYEYTLSAPFDISAPVIAGDFSVSTQDSSPTDVALSNDGAKMFVVGYFNEKIYEYTLTTAFSVSSATFASDTSVSQDFYPDGMAFSNDGAKMFMVGDEKNSIYEYALSTAFDVSTAVFADSTFSVTAQETSPTGMAFSSDGTKMFVVGINGIKVNEYTLSAPFDISTPIFVGNFSVSFQDTNPEDLAFSSDGAKMFIVGNAGNDISEYALSSVYPITVTASVASDTAPPTISLVGPNPAPITVGTSYTDAGATCTDTVDGAITPTSSGTVDASQAGTYTVTYSCQDAAGNSAPDVSRGVIVEAAPVSDTTPPTLALIGPDPETITVGAPYTDAGATCTDTVDGAITPTSSGTVDASQAGTYTLTYSCRDAAGNDAPGVSRTVTVSAAVINTGQNPPTFVSSTLNNATGVLAITFSEDIDVTPAANVVPTKIHVRESGSYTGGITLSAGELATAVDGTVISFTLTAQHLAAVKGLAVPELTIEPGAVKDTSGDLIVGTFDVSTAAFVDAFSVSTQDPNPRGMAFSSDGTKMFVAGFASSSVYEYTLSAPFDISAPVIAGDFSVSTQDSSPTDVALSNDGAKMFVVGYFNEKIYEYTLTTAFSVSSATFASDTSVSQDFYPDGMAFSNDGAKMFMVGDEKNSIYEYALSTAFDVSTAVFADSTFSVTAQETSPTGMAFSSDGTKMFVVGINGIKVNEYTLSAPFDISTPIFVGNFSVSFQDTNPEDLAFSSDGAKMFIVGNAGNDISEYALSSVYPITVTAEAAPVVPDTTAPVITLAGPASVTITVGATYDDEGAACTDDVDASLAPTVSTDTVDAGTAGTYAVTYACADAAGNQADPVSRTVIVEAAPVVPDTTAPVITLAGPASVTITVGATYDDEGAACTDDVDGTIEPTSTDNVDTSQAGTYTLTYSCQDAAGNDATPVEREVIVSAAVINTGQNPPTFVSSTLNNATGVLAVTFSEDIDVTPAANVVPAKIHVRESGSYTGGITLSAGELATAVDGTVISFTLTAQHLAAVNGLAVPELTIEPGAVKDTSGDLIVGTFDVSTATFTDTVFSVSPQDSDPRGMAFSSDGTKMFVVDYDSANVNEYTLSAPFDISAPVIAGDFSVSTQDSSPTDVALSNDGTKMFVVGQDSEKIYEYALSAPFDLSTATFANDTSVSQYFYPDGMAFSNDGTKMFVVGYYSNAKINEYALTAPFDISTATFTDTVFSVSSQETFPSGMAFSSDGTKMFVVGIGGMKVNEYALSAPFDISTPIFVDNFSVSSQDTYPEDLAFSSDGAKMFIVGYDGSDINEYTLSSVYPITVTVTVIPYVPDLAPVRV